MTTRQEAIDGVNRLFDRIEADGRTIPLRIRVGVTADGKWSAFGRQNGEPSMSPTDIVAEDLEGHGPIAAWHWITAEVPMPEVEQGEVAGEVER